MSEKYQGVHPEHEAKKTRDPEYSHTEQHGGKEVKYYHTWRREWENEVRPTFRDDEEPNQPKIRAIDFIVRIMWLVAIWFIIKYIL